eukprot:4816744-Prymnesium_polylepis.1
MKVSHLALDALYQNTTSSLPHPTTIHCTSWTHFRHSHTPTIRTSNPQRRPPAPPTSHASERKLSQYEHPTAHVHVAQSTRGHLSDAARSGLQVHRLAALPRAHRAHSTVRSQPERQA